MKLNISKTYFSIFIGVLTIIIVDSSICIGQCDNITQFPQNVIQINPGYNILISNIFAGEFCVTNNYSTGKEYMFQSEISSDYLTIRKSSDNSIIAHGTSPLSFVYNSIFGDLEIHVNTNSNCDTQNEERFISYNSLCANSDQYPSGIIELNCGKNIIADDIFAGDYFKTIGYEVGKEVIYTSSNNTDFITLRKENGSFIEDGQSPLSLIYEASYGAISVHINKNQNCGIRQVPRTIDIYKVCECANLTQYPDNTIYLSCGEDTITTSQYAGEFNVTSGYIEGKDYIFNSSNRTDYLTIKSSLDQSIIAAGLTPQSITYYNVMGNIEMHVNSDKFCGETNELRTTYITSDCHCSAPAFTFDIKAVQCNDTVSYQSYAGESKNTSGYEIGQNYIITSSVPTDYITLRKTSDNEFLVSGQSPLTYLHEEYIDEIKIHLFSDSLCGEEFTIYRDVNISAECVCYNSNLFPNSVNYVQCDTNIISNQQYAGEYNLTSGYIQNRNVTYTSSVNTDYIRLRKTLGKAIIAEGFTPLSIIYDSLMGDIEMHINSDSLCGADANNRITSVIIECIDLDNDGIEDSYDNCQGVSNFVQSDLDMDGIGDACDADEISLNNVGIGTENPFQKLHIKDGNIYIDKPTGGLIFKTMSGYCVKVTFTETEGLTYNFIDCPASN